MSKPTHRYKPDDTVWIVVNKPVEITCDHCGSELMSEHKEVALQGTVSDVHEGRTAVNYGVETKCEDWPIARRQLGSHEVYPTQAEAEAALAASNETENG